MSVSRARRARVLTARVLRGLRRHSLSLVSAAVLAGLAVLALSSDAFRASRATPVAAPEFRMSWAPAFAVDPEVAAGYLDAMMGLTPIERARQRPRLTRPDATQPFSVTLPDLSDQERSEALLTALADAEALGLTLRVIEN